MRLFSWLLGEESGQRLVRLDEMGGWTFYDSADDMRFAYEYGGLRERWDCERREILTS